MAVASHCEHQQWGHSGVPESFGADGDDEVGVVQLAAEPRHLTFFTHLQMFPQVQHNLNTGEQPTVKVWTTLTLVSLFITVTGCRCGAWLSHLTVAEVLQEVGEALDDAGVLGTVSVGVTDEDFGSRPRPLRVQRRALIGRLAALLVQLAVDVFWQEKMKR